MKVFNRARALMLALVLSLGVAACDFAGLNDAIDGFKVIVGLEEISTPVSVKFVDAATGELVTSKVELSFSGADGDAVVDLFNDPITSGKATYTGGVGSFGIANDLTPTEATPVSVRLTARAQGYDPQVRSVELTEEGRQSVIVRMSSITNPPEGTSTAREQTGSADQSGAIVNEIRISTPNNGGIPGGASLRIEEGTIARNAAGQPLKGALTTRVTYASASSAKALSTLPGGFGAEVEGSDGGIMTSAAFATIQVSDASGNYAKTFGRPIDIEMDIAPGTINPKTGAVLAEGDELDVFSFDVEEGLWKREGKVTLYASNGLLRGSFRADHLSTWSFGARVSYCLAEFAIETNGNSVTSVRVWNSNFSETFSVPAIAQGMIRITKMLLVPANVAFEYEIKGTSTYRGTIANSCDGANITLPVDPFLVAVTLENIVTPCPVGQNLKAGYEGEYGLELAEGTGATADWESAQSTTVSVVTEGKTIRGTANVNVRRGSTYRLQGSFNEEEITGSIDIPMDVVTGDVLSAEIDNKITNDIAADACE